MPQQQKLVNVRHLTACTTSDMAGIVAQWAHTTCLSAQQRHATEQLAGLQGHISAQRQLVVQQGAQIAALQAQLQLLLQLLQRQQQ